MAQLPKPPGQRVLRWQDVDFAKRILHVRRNFTYGAEGAPKSGKVRSVPLIDQAARALDTLSRRGVLTEPEDLVFISPAGGVVDDSKLRRRYYTALDRAKLTRLKFHSLRHTFGTVAVQAFPLSDVKAFMGHADIQTTMVYVHHVPSTTPPTDSGGWLRRPAIRSSKACPQPCPELGRTEPFVEQPVRLWNAESD